MAEDQPQTRTTHSSVLGLRSERVALGIDMAGTRLRSVERMIRREKEAFNEPTYDHARRISPTRQSV